MVVKFGTVILGSGSSIRVSKVPTILLVVDMQIHHTRQNLPP